MLVALPWASNATGTVFDVPALARAAKAAGATVVVDGVQAFPHFPLDIPAAVDFAFFSAYKCYAPHVAFWYLSRDAATRFLHADDDRAPSEARYWTLETGTQSHEALAGWLGTVAYLRDVAPDARRALAAFARYEATLSDHARRCFAERAEKVTLYGRPAERERLPVFAFNIAGVDGEAVAQRFKGRRHRSALRRLLRAPPDADDRRGSRRPGRAHQPGALQYDRRRRPLFRRDRRPCRMIAICRGATP